MRSCFTTDVLEFQEMGRDVGPPPSDQLDLIHLLKGSRTTLGSITLHAGNLSAIVTSTGPVYPRMVELELEPMDTSCFALPSGVPELEISMPNASESNSRTVGRSATSATPCVRPTGLPVGRTSKSTAAGSRLISFRDDTSSLPAWLHVSHRTCLL
ncbi:hypothetical protein OH76DRAFT_661166 [Lentinus brumalis]|uniref:Uncharacterized protein n=1 Tax=Lentinus brumalis TaxID=2498619 RepID=A0A371D7N1_9APHY|nr:hypothetical protein OH76DRAFT_661166 [Polyporus brumalis]